MGWHCPYEKEIRVMNDSSDAASLSQNQESMLLRQLRETPAIFERISQSKEQPLRLQASLRSDFDSELVRAALAVHEARQRASALLP